MSLLNSSRGSHAFGSDFPSESAAEVSSTLVPSARVWYRPLRRRQYDGARRLPATVLRVGAVRTLLDVELGNGAHVRVAVSRSRIDPDGPGEALQAPSHVADTCDA
jgi:hypothetical protein